MEFFPRAKFRELVFIVLYSLDQADQDIDTLIDTLYDYLKVSKKHLRDAYDLAKVILSKKEEIDVKIKEISVDYEFERILKVELNLIRLALYEMLEGNIPVPVAISEAIRLSRKFSSPESGKYVNAILDQFNKGLVV
jgi:N utilization substance protein B